MIIFFISLVLFTIAIVIYLFYYIGQEPIDEIVKDKYPPTYGIGDPTPPTTVPNATWSTNPILKRNGRSDLKWASDIYDTMVGNPLGTTEYPSWVDEKILRGKAEINKNTAQKLCYRPCNYYEPKHELLYNGLCHCYPNAPELPTVINFPN